MSARAVTKEGGGAAPPQATKPPGQPRRAPEHPRLADGVRLVGAMKESAYVDPPWLIDREGVGYLQVSQLLYQIAEACDGRRSPEEIARHITEEGEPMQ